MTEKEVAIRAALKAGKLLTRNYGKVSFKSDTKDVFSDIDKKSERVIIKEISKKFPYHTIISEESDLEKKDSEYEWYIDPVDGTINYVSQIPIFCISIGLFRENEPVLGVIYDPLRDEMFVAEKNKGAYLNGKILRVRKITKIEKANISTDIGHGDRESISQYIKKVINNVTYMHILGSAGIGLSYVANSKIQGYFNTDLRPWDMAAGVLLVKEAGGKVTDLKGKEWNINKPDVLATNGYIHKELLKVLATKK